MEFSDLCSRIAIDPKITDALGLMTLLLRYCKEHSGRYRAPGVDQSRARGVEKTVREQTLVELARVSNSLMTLPGDAARRWNLSEILTGRPDSVAPEAFPVHAARGMALAFDKVFDKLVFRMFAKAHGDRVWKARPGDPLPMPRPRNVEGERKGAKSGDPDRLLTNPSDLADYPDWLPSLRLVPDLPDGFEVYLDTRFCDDLQRVGSGSRLELKVGTGVLNQQAHIESREELVWDHADGADTFFNVGPASSADQVERMKLLLAKARKAEIDLLVFPELCIDSGGIGLLFEHYHGTAGHPLLLVGGSYHAERPDLSDPDRVVRVNRAEAAFREIVGEDRRLWHHKYCPFHYDDPASNRIHEDITAAPRRLTVCLSESWSFTMLICRDFLDHRFTHPLLEGLGVNLLMVPAFSENLAAFDAILTKLLQTNHCVVVIANNPIERVFAGQGQSRDKDMVAIAAYPSRIVNGKHRHIATIDSTKYKAPLLYWTALAPQRRNDVFE